RKVWLPSGGTLVIDRTEAMTVVDVNTGKFTGTGGNLEETVTKNNLEAAEEIVRQMRLRDLGGMIVVDFIDMVLPENQELVLRRWSYATARFGLHDRGVLDRHGPRRDTRSARVWPEGGAWPRPHSPPSLGTECCWPGATAAHARGRGFVGILFYGV